MALMTYGEKLEGQLTALAQNTDESNLSQALVNSSINRQQLQQVIANNQTQLDRLNVNLGLIQQHENQSSQAVQTWQTVLNQGGADTEKALARLLLALYQNQPLLPKAETLIQDQLSGWFQWQALDRLYRRQANIQDQAQACETAACLTLAQTMETQAQQALLKLGLLNSLPLLGGGIGLLLLVGLLVQWALRRENAILATNAQTKWVTPWAWETIWQVLVVGFFFSSQILLPVAIGLLPLQVSGLTLVGKAVYVLGTYTAIAVWGIGVLAISLRTFRPLPADWFKVSFSLPALLWGGGGYLVALPLVVLISLLNQEIWQGQGGSNPLLSLALESQNWLVLGIFFFTAAVLAPLFEELIFRGFLLPSLTRYFPVWLAILASSLLFAIAHLNLSEVLPLLVLGCVLGVVYSRSRNLVASMTLHSLWNSGTLISLFILGNQ
jgi:membrane protease YdiL (CAAX protease family)